VCPLLPAGTSSATRLLGKIQVTHRCHFLELQMLRFSLLQRKRTREKNEVQPASPSILQNVAEKHFFFFFNYYFGRSAVFPWLPFVKIPAAGIRVNSRSSRGSPEVGCCGLGQGEDAGIAQRLHCQQCLPSAPPLPRKRQSCALFYAFFPSSRLFPHWGHAAVTRKFIKPRNCKENVDLSPCCQIRVA